MGKMDGAGAGSGAGGSGESTSRKFPETREEAFKVLLSDEADWNSSFKKTLRIRYRNYMRRNHPDKVPPTERDLATTASQFINDIYDKMSEALAKSRLCTYIEMLHKVSVRAVVVEPEVPAEPATSTTHKTSHKRSEKRSSKRTYDITIYNTSPWGPSPKTLSTNVTFHSNDEQYEVMIDKLFKMGIFSETLEALDINDCPYKTKQLYDFLAQLHPDYLTHVKAKCLTINTVKYLAGLSSLVLWYQENEGFDILRLLSRLDVELLSQIVHSAEAPYLRDIRSVTGFTASATLTGLEPMHFRAFIDADAKLLPEQSVIPEFADALYMAVQKVNLRSGRSLADQVGWKDVQTMIRSISGDRRNIYGATSITLKNNDDIYQTIRAVIEQLNRALDGSTFSAVIFIEGECKPFVLDTVPNESKAVKYRRLGVTHIISLAINKDHNCYLIDPSSVKHYLKTSRSSTATVFKGSPTGTVVPGADFSKK